MFSILKQVSKIEWVMLSIYFILLSIGLLPPQKAWISLIYGSFFFRTISIIVLLLWLVSLFFSDRKRTIIGVEHALPYLLPTIAFLSLIILPAGRFEDPPWGSGDSLYLTEFIPAFSHIFGFLATSDELLELFIRSILYELLHSKIGIINSLGLYSYLAGLIHIGAVYAYLRQKPNSWLLPGWLILFFAPTSVLYANYIENYSMSRALLIAITLFSLVVMESNNRRSRIRIIHFIAVLSAVAVAHHLISGLILPALIYLLFIVSKQEQSPIQFFAKEALIAALISVFIMAVIFGSFYFSEFKIFIFEDSHVQIQSLRSVGSLLTSKTLINIIQLTLLLPASLFVFPKLLVKQPQSKYQFLLIAFLPFFIFAVIWNPAIGFPADWDLFTYFLIPLSVFTLHRFSDSFPLSFRSLLLLLTLTIIPGLTWQLWLHQKTPLTVKNIQYIKHLHTNTLPFLDSGSLIKNLPLKQQKSALTIYLIREKILYRINTLESESRLSKEKSKVYTDEINTYWPSYYNNATDDKKLLEALSHFYTIYTEIDTIWNQSK